MQPQDIFVGLCAAIVGCLFVAGALTNSARLMSLAKLRLLAESVGATTTRWMLAVFGVVLLAMGAVIAVGWRPW